MASQTGSTSSDLRASSLTTRCSTARSSRRSLRTSSRSTTTERRSGALSRAESSPARCVVALSSELVADESLSVQRRDSPRLALHDQPRVLQRHGQEPPDSRSSFSRLLHHSTNARLQEGEAKLEKVRKLGDVATKLGTTQAALALAWAANNPNVSTVILGASKPEQVTANLEALNVLPKLTPDILAEIEKILDNKPVGPATYGR